jgi:hypothetical protein
MLYPQERQLELEADVRKKQQDEIIRKQLVEARHAKESTERKAAIENALRASEEAAIKRVAAEKGAKLDARRNRTIMSAMGATEQANKLANTDAEIRSWELELETKR